LYRPHPECLPSSRQEFATDGERLYFTIDNRQSDIWVMAVEGWE
jgi:hypothetical protein